MKKPIDITPILDALPPNWQVRFTATPRKGKYRTATVINAIGGCVAEVKTEGSFALLTQLLTERMRTLGYYPEREAA